MGVLDTFIPVSIPYPIRGGIIRGVRTAVAFILAGVAASIADGSVIASFHFIPAAYDPAVLLGLGAAFTGVDKWFRERGLVEDIQNMNPQPLTDEVVAVEPIVGTDPVDHTATGAVDGVDPVVFDDPPTA